MKKILLFFLFIFLINTVSAQVIFGDNVGTAANKTSVLMEFSNAGNRGIILPYITDKTGLTTPGSIILNATTPTAAKVEYYNGTTWVDLSVQTANVSAFLGIQPAAKENANAKMIIGSATSTADGILVLESANKAMVLPVVSSYQDIVNPAPGMMALVNNGGIKTLAVYNGNQWSFWNY
ncbi:hypothetical protein LUD75_18575 [Epilithonimonas sp. JDS]|uniref:hypothetical protein n=1 Tax=Epilithonimonas sp. JDS TaxID=2902797 RepID=UPI001E505E84|nr:hypothetical protein [Epilithonimonas sp. JDS]MCD9856736.1 hypothetical protein [Epilithonimonas sp. JDS]